MIEHLYKTHRCNLKVIARRATFSPGNALTLYFFRCSRCEESWVVSKHRLWSSK